MNHETQTNWPLIIVIMIAIAWLVMFTAEKAQAFGYTDERAFRMTEAASYESGGVMYIRPANIISDYSRVTCMITHQGIVVQTIVAKMKGRVVEIESPGSDLLVFCQLAN